MYARRRRLVLLMSFALTVAFILSVAANGTAAGGTTSRMAAWQQRMTMMVTNAQREAAAKHLAAARAKAKANRSTVGATAKAVMNPLGMPDYYGSVPNYANSALPVGPVGSYIVVNGGTGYSASPSVTVSDISWGSGSNATASATVTGGTITAINVVNAGSGYVAPTVSITDPTGSGANAIAVLDSASVTGGIRKFVDSLPGLGSANPNNLGEYIPVAVADQTTFPNSDYYEIALVQYTHKFSTDVAASMVRGYVQVETPANAGKSKHIALKYPDGTAIKDATGAQVYAVDDPNYLGPSIIAQSNTPVRVKFTNYLPTGSAGDLFLPVDTTLMGAGLGPLGAAAGNYKQNRGELHLHGGVTPWISDGTPYQWTTPAGETTSYTRGVSVQFVPDMWFSPTTYQVVPAGTAGATNDPGPGSLTYYYTNQQSARLMFYHDHASGITRLNVYGGEAAPYVLQDSAENTLVTGGTISGVSVPAGTIPATQFPLVIQDKTFVPDQPQLANEDPTWSTAKWGGTGNLWLGHVYMTNQVPNSSGVAPMGRWDYAFWFYPPMVGIMNGPVPNPLAGLPGEGTQNPGTPNPTIVPESFMDTPVVNGTAYPYLKVSRKAYRFRILNACDDRSLNLQLYFAKSNGQMWDAGGALLDANAGEVNMVPAVAGTTGTAGYTTGQTDGRAGGLPDASKAGPSMIQIGNEGGFLPAPVVLPNQPVGYEYFRRTITALNVSEKTLTLGPAERADVIIDFSQVPAGSKLIMYNDAPAPMPGFDSRLDYYTGDPNQTDIGGAPDTTPGYGPDTRTIMQFQVDSSSPDPAYDLGALQTALPAAYGATQPKPIVPESAYGPAFNTTYPDKTMGVIDPSLTFTPAGQASAVTLASQEKAIIEGFDMMYGRMNANLGAGLPNVVGGGAAVPYAYADPPSDVLTNTVAGSQIGTLADGTQIWRIDHQGVDTHSIHFHLVNVQLINRVALDGQIFPTDPNELGWKETIRMNPGQDVIIAMRPIAPSLPFKLADSVRPLDPDIPVGTSFMNAQGLMVPNVMQNFGWEYVWHCHLLGHEENDMMRPFVLQAAPSGPTGLKAVLGTGSTSATLTWLNNATNPAATQFVIQRATNSAFSAGLTSFTATGANVVKYVNTGLKVGTTYYYRLRAENAIAYSPWSNQVKPGAAPAAATALKVSKVVYSRQATANMTITWTNKAVAGVTVNGIRVIYATAANGPWTTIASLASTAKTYTFKNLPVGTKYWVKLETWNGSGASTSAVVSRLI